jgi:hypothetical protein
MKGYLTRKGDRWYTLIYQGLDRSPAGNGAAGFPPVKSCADADKLTRQARTRV